jgi:hypothetical protein
VCKFCSKYFSLENAQLHVDLHVFSLITAEREQTDTPKTKVGTRGLICNSLLERVVNCAMSLCGKLLLVFASAVILGSYSRGNHDNISVSHDLTTPRRYLLGLLICFHSFRTIGLPRSISTGSCFVPRLQLRSRSFPLSQSLLLPFSSVSS